MEFFQLLDTAWCSEDVKVILGLVNSALNIIRWVIPIILIVMVTMDIAKIVTTGNNDEKEVKAAQKKFTTRIIYALIIFLIPTIVKAVFSLITLPNSDTTIIDCMNGENIADKDQNKDQKDDQ